MDDLSRLLSELASLISQNKFEELESDSIEFKPCPSNNQDWNEHYKSINAFLNTRGGFLILGIKESGTGNGRRYEVTGYDASVENKLVDLTKSIYTDAKGQPLHDLKENLPPPEIRNFMDKRIAILRIDELSADKRFAFFKGKAYKRILTGDHLIKEADIERHAEFLEEIAQAKELQLINSHGPEGVNLDRLNEYILQLNKLQKIESLKPTIEDAIPFLNRKRFLIENKMTYLGGLVCGLHPGDLLGFRSHVHGYVNAQAHDAMVVQDKQDMIDNVLPLLEQANAYVMRNIYAGIATAQGGQVKLQYPEAVLRETINNAIAHRDYSINKQIVIAITPNKQIEISNPGKFKAQLLISHQTPTSPKILRVVPETKPRNPKLADVLRVYRKWEGRGIGMSTLVSLSLDSKLNLPYFKFKSDEVTLVLQSGELIDEQMIELFSSRDAYIAKRLGSFDQLSTEKMAVLAYLIKSEWANQEGKYTILLTPDNNHAQALKTLESSGLISRDSISTDFYPVYLVDRNLLSDNFEIELRERFGEEFDNLPILWRRVLAVIYRYNHFSSKQAINAKQASLALWQTEAPNKDISDVRAFDNFSRNIRAVFNKLEERGFVEKDTSARSKGYLLTKSFKRNIQTSLF